MSSEENENQLIISNTGGLIRRMDHQLELMNRVLGEIAERKTEIISAAPSFIGMRAGEERDWEIAPGVKMTFCWCPPGDFLMGSPETEEGRHENENQVHVTLTKGFWMAKTQVTQKQWTAIMGVNDTGFIEANHPIECIKWDEAQEFIRKINAIIGNADDGLMVLPTEAQWEYACRAGEKGPYSGGDVDDVAWHGEDFVTLHANYVGTKKPNLWGLHDMHGNVLEWCADWYNSKLEGGIDPNGPSGPTNGEPMREARVVRGGSIRATHNRCRAASRDAAWPEPLYLLLGTGFRVARISIS